MPSFRRGVVARIVSERPGLQRVLVSAGGGASDTLEPAFVLTQLCPSVRSGDEVLYNSTAVDLALGTGGSHVIHTNLSRPEADLSGHGHVMKLRYTGIQVDTGVAEEHLDELVTTLGDVPVVACTLHSQVGVVAGRASFLEPNIRVAYVMTDGGALPLALSDLVFSLRSANMLVGTVTAGHAFGGDLEAVGVPSALAVARQELEPDLIIVGLGPGVVGTQHALGTSALEAATTLDLAEALGGRPVLCVRASSADSRERHLGVSHHAHTVLDLTRVRVDVPVPPALLDGVAQHAPRHRIFRQEACDPTALDSALRASGVAITTMGRDAATDPLFFQAAAAAADHAVDLVRGR